MRDAPSPGLDLEERGRGGWAAAAVAGLWLGLPEGLRAHVGRPPEPHDLWSAWTLEPGVLLGVGILAGAYAHGTVRLWNRAGVGRGVRTVQVGCFAAGLAALLLALTSPLHALGSALFSAHMAQHELLMLAAAPLLVLGTPAVALLWSLPRRARRAVARWTPAPGVRRAGRALASPGAAWLIQLVVLWGWHAPPLYQSTLGSEAVHVLQHLSFLGAAVLFWEVLRRMVRRSRGGFGVGILYVFTAGVAGTMLGALLTFSSTAWYPVYQGTTTAWGLTPLEDQQLGGVIMWVPFGLVYVSCAVGLVVGWLRALERTAAARDSAAAAPQGLGSDIRALP